MKKPLTLEKIQQGLTVKVVPEPFQRLQFRVEVICLGVPLPSSALIENVLKKHLAKALYRAEKKFPSP